MSGESLVKRRYSSTTWQRTITSERASFGCDGSLLWTGNRRPSRIGRGNATEHGEASSKSLNMIQNEQEYRTTLKRIERFQRQIEELRKREASPENYRL